MAFVPGQRERLTLLSAAACRSTCFSCRLAMGSVVVVYGVGVGSACPLPAVAACFPVRHDMSTGGGAFLDMALRCVAWSIPTLTAIVGSACPPPAQPYDTHLLRFCVVLDDYLCGGNFFLADWGVLLLFYLL